MAEENKQPKPAAAAQPPAADAVQAKPADGKAPVKKKHGRTVPFAVVHISCTFNNTIVTVTDDRGGAIAWATAGGCGFKGTKKGTPFAAQITSNKAMQKASEMGVREVAILVNGPGPGRETAIRAIQAAGIRVVSIRDVTPLPHNGCRPPKARRM